MNELKTPSTKRERCSAKALLVILMCCALIGASLFGCAKKPDEAPVAEPETSITLKVNAPGWEKDASTPVIVHVEPKGPYAATRFSHALPANEEHAIDVSTGEYEITCVSPINPDGSIYRVPNASDIEVSAGGTAEVELDLIPAGEVTQEDLDRVLDDIAEAVKYGDETLSGDAGKDSIDKAAANAAANPNADAQKVEEKADGAKQEASNVLTETDPSSNGSSGSGNKPNVSDPQPSQPAHQHNWTPKYTAVHHDAVTEQVWVPNNVYVPRYTCGTCGYNSSTPEEAVAHQKASGRGGCGAYFSNGYYEDRGYNETRVVSDAWDEQIVTGYVCSSCGAAK